MQARFRSLYLEPLLEAGHGWTCSASPKRNMRVTLWALIAQWISLIMSDLPSGHVNIAIEHGHLQRI